MAVRFPSRREKQVELNMAPLIDVVFLLLVFFLLTSSAMLNQLDLQSPAKTAETLMLGDLLASTVMIDRAGGIALDGLSLQIDELRAAVSNKIRASALERPFVVRPAPETSVALLVRVLDELQAGGVRNLQIGETLDRQTEARP